MDSFDLPDWKINGYVQHHPLIPDEQDDLFDLFWLNQVRFHFSGAPTAQRVRRAYSRRYASEVFFGRKGDEERLKAKAKVGRGAEIGSRPSCP